jgi:hypothetical protein
MVVRGMKTFEGGWAILVRCPVEEVRKLESDGEGGREDEDEDGRRSR